MNLLNLKKSPVKNYTHGTFLKKLNQHLTSTNPQAEIWNVTFQLHYPMNPLAEISSVTFRLHCSMSLPAEIGALAVFLCRREAHNITGAALPVDGGWTAQ